jgi:hypothetical protein
MGHELHLDIGEDMSEGMNQGMGEDDTGEDAQ